MTTSDYINRAYRPQPGRKYWNHMAEHTPGAWHRHALLSSGQYIKTSERDQDCIDGTLSGLRLFNGRVVGGPGPELINFRPGGVVHDPRLVLRPGEHIIHPDGRAWTVGE